MAPKLKVWRLQSEERHVKERAIRVLVLRDEHGAVKRVAKSISEEAELKRWYRNYNHRTKTEESPVSKKLREKLASAKRRFREQGFSHGMSCYGTT